jgi:hypothetical protein
MQCKQHHPAKLADTKMRKKAAPGPRERAAIKARYDEILKDPKFRPRTDFPVGRQKFVEFVNEEFGEGPLPPPRLQVVRKESVQEDEKKVNEPHLQVVRKESIQEGEKKEKKVDEPQQYNTEIPHLQVVRKESVQEDEKKEKKVDELQQDNPEIPHLQVVRKESIQEGEKKEKKVNEPQQDNPEIAQKRLNDGEDQSMAHAQLQLETDEHRDMTETPLVERCMNNFVGNPGGEEGEGAGVPEAAEEATAQHPHLLGQGQGRSKATTADIERAQIAQKRFYHEFTTENRDDDEDDDDDDHPVTHELARIYRITHPSRNDESKGIR